LSNPNAELLLKSYDSTFLWLILRLNEKRKKEIKDQNVKREVEKIRRRMKKLDRLSEEKNQIKWLTAFCASLNIVDKRITQRLVCL